MLYKFLGVENIGIFSGVQTAYKYELLTSTDSITYLKWIGLNGLLKRYLYIPRSEAVDSLGAIIGSIRSWDIYELIGRTDINPDTLKPWGKN
jgi:hypothetical protein